MTDPIDVLAEAIHRSDCGCTDWHPKDPEDAMYDQYATAAAEAVRGMDPATLAELLDTEVERSAEPDLSVIPGFTRAVGPWVPDGGGS